MSKVFLELVSVEDNREDLLAALADLSDFDCKFNGKKGIEYAWEETKEKGFKSNLEYLLDKVKNIESDTECVTEFFLFWMARDNFYIDYSVRCLTDTNGKAYAIAFSATVEP